MSEATTNIEALIKKLISLSTANNLDEAIICGRTATREDPDNANAWWQLGHVLVKKHGLASGLEAFKKTTELAPSFAEGWCQLGFAYQKTGQLNEAIENYEKALLQDDEHSRTLKLLAPALKSRGLAGDEERRLEVLKKLREIGELDDSERFSLAFALTQSKEYHEAQRIYEEHFLDKPSAAAANNLGVTHERQGRNLDALDCYRIALKFDPTDELYKKNVRLTLERIGQYEKLIAANLHILDSSDWYRNYINPYVLMGFQDDLDYTDIKLIQKQKKALYHEITLEEGRISWLNNHLVDISSAKDICEKLADENYARLQYEIYENTALCDFLMTGSLNFFLSRDRPNEGYFELKFQLSPEFIAAISNTFATQLDMVLCEALEKRNLPAVQCLLSGRRLVRDEDVDACFAGTKRLIQRMLEPIKALAEMAENTTVDVKAAMATCSKDSIHTLLSILPSEFLEVQRDYYGHLFTISREIYRDGSGIENALHLIDLAAPIARVSVDVNDRLSDAKKQLNDLLAKEKQKEVHLNFGDKKFALTKQGAEYGSVKITSNEVRALRWGIVIVSNSPRTADFSVGISNLYGREILVSWRSSDIDGQKKVFQRIIDGIFEYLFESALESFSASMNRNEQISMGGIDLNGRGATFTYDGWFSKKTHFAVWSQIRHESDNGDLVLQSRNEQKAVARLSFASTWNAVVLGYYLKQLKG